MIMVRLKIFLLLAFMAMLVISCNDDETPVDPTAGLIKITEATDVTNDIKVELWAKEALFVGYNPVFFLLSEASTNKRITDAHVHIHPMMYMGSGMNHTCPYENPADEEAVNQLFPAGIMFVMPSSDMDYWELEVEVHNHHNGKTGSVELDITVANPTVARMKSFTTAGGDKYFISYMFPEEMKVGINDFEVIANKRVSGMEWPAEEGLTFTLTPEMPSMGHGSPNNVNPVHDASGHYKGKVNFTMTGEWRLNLEIRKAGELLNELYFDVTLE